MTWLPTETQKAIFAVLSEDEELISLLGSGQRIFDNVPQNMSYPYVTMQIKPWADRANTTWDGLTGELTIGTWCRAAGDLPVQTIQKRIDELLNNTDPCIEGGTVISFRRTMIDILQDPDGVTLHGVQKFNLKIGEG